jgi:hypothetical protein
MSGNESKAEAHDLETWGEYAEACQQFSEKVKVLPGVRAVAAKHCGDYVDLWVMADETRQIELIRPVGTALKQVWGRFPQLYFDSFVTRQEIPANFVILFEAL